jgi:hypothetical protein
MNQLEAFDGRFVSLIGLAAFAAIVLVMMAISIYRNKKARIEAEAEQEQLIKEGIERGDIARNPLTGEIHTRCIICGGKATYYAPQSGISWMDQLPLLNRLYCLSPRYILEDNEDGHLQYCRSHYSMAIKRLEQFHSELRAQSAQFNADQADKVAHMDAGGLVQIIREQHQKMAERLLERQEALNKVAQLPAATPPAPDSTDASSRQVLSIVSSADDDERSGEEEESVANGT